MKKLTLALALLAALATTTNAQKKSTAAMSEKTKAGTPAGLSVATFGAGCFWCTEAVFLSVKGVEKVESGYMGGTIENPTYAQVSSGNTGYAEVTQIFFDPKVVTYENLLEFFWNTHDPTTLNKQGADEGTQYRSVVFFHSDEQKQIAEAYKKQLTASHVFKNPIVTEITPASVFYKAEDYHQNYYALNQNQGYCQYVIRPKVEKFKKQFGSKLKPATASVK